MQRLKIDDIIYNIEINSSEDYIFDVSDEKAIKLNLNLGNNVNSNLYINLLNTNSFEFNFKLETNSKMNIFMFNQNECDTKVFINANMDTYSDLNLSFAEFNDKAIEVNCNVLLNGEYATACINSATLANCNKKYTINCTHHDKNTSSTFNNYAVLLESGDLYIDATGKINAGCSGSKSHQTTKALTFSQQKQAVIFPQLLIDENDVEASHAMTLGRIDDEQMYYLQTRGISEKMATELITIGYLMPILENIHDSSVKEQYQKIVESCVNNIC